MVTQGVRFPIKIRRKQGQCSIFVCLQRLIYMHQLRYPLVLASGSPRRRQLMTDAGFAFTIEVRPTDESFPADLPADDVAEYLARQKAEQFSADLGERLVLCADTVVILDNQILNKPADEADAHRMLSALAGRTHRVRTGVCLLAPAQYESPCL